MKKIQLIVEGASGRGAVQKTRELELLLEKIKKIDPKVIMEIGTAWGGVFFALCQISADNATIISIDLLDGSFIGEAYEEDMEIRLKSFAKDSQRVHFLMRDSHDEVTKEEITNLLNGSLIDILFIDGDHSYKGVKQDYQMYSPLVRKDGLIIFHDILYSKFMPNIEVYKFWDEIRKEKKHTEIVSDDIDWGGIGVIYR